MANENKDLNKSQSVADADLNKDQSVAGQDLNASGQSDESAKLADGTDENKSVPYAEMKKAIDGRKAAEEAQELAEQQLQQTRDQMALMQAVPVQPQTAPEKPVSTYEQAVRDCGLIGEQFLTQEQQIQVNARKDQLDAVRTQQNQQAFADQQFAQSHPDFGKAVGQLNPTGQFVASAELQKILMEKPYLRASCSTAQGAYEVVMEERQLAKLLKEKMALEDHQKQQQIDADLAPMSPAAVGGGAVNRTQGQITESSTAEDVLATERRVKAGEFG